MILVMPKLVKDAHLMESRLLAVHSVVLLAFIFLIVAIITGTHFSIFKEDNKRFFLRHSRA